jgi:hypothetical protein
MPIQKTITVYTIEELSPKAKEKALEKMREIFETDYEFIELDASEYLKNLGYGDVDISFSGFYSQGDGASFVTKDGVDILQWFAHQPVNVKASFPLTVKFLESQGINANVYRIDNHYSHENTISAQVNQYDNLDDNEIQNALDTELVKLEELIKADARQESKYIYKMFRDYYEADTTDEMMIENATANDFTFDEYGNLA